MNQKIQDLHKLTTPLRGVEVSLKCTHFLSSAALLVNLSEACCHVISIFTGHILNHSQSHRTEMGKMLKLFGTTLIMDLV